MTNPKAATFKDSFATVALSTCWQKDGAPHGAGPGLVLAANEDVLTSDFFDLTDSAAWVKWTTLPGPGGEARLDLLSTDSFTPARIRYRPDTGFLSWISFLDPLFGPTPSRQRPPENLFDGELDWRFRFVAPDLLWETSTDGGATWTLRRSQNRAGQDFTACIFSLVSNGASAVVASYNGGGVPHCPTDPLVAFVPVDAAPTAQTFTWRDAKGFTGVTQTYLLGTVDQVAAAAAALRPLLEACSDAALNGALGPYHLDRFTFGASAHGAAIGDQLVVAGLTHRTGRTVELVVPAAQPSLFDANGAGDVTGGPVGALADYWQRHAVTADGEAFYAHAARRRRQGQRRVYSTITRRPTLGGQGL